MVCHHDRSKPKLTNKAYDRRTIKLTSALLKRFRMLVRCNKLRNKREIPTAQSGWAEKSCSFGYQGRQRTLNRRVHLYGVFGVSSTRRHPVCFASYQFLNISTYSTCHFRYVMPVVSFIHSRYAVRQSSPRRLPCFTSTEEHLCKRLCSIGSTFHLSHKTMRLLRFQGYFILLNSI